MTLSGWKKGLLGVGLGGALALVIVIHGKSTPSRSPANLTSDDYHAKIQPIFDNRCVVCHSCYNSPCQLNLTAYEGVDRGATKNLVYEPERLKAVHPTRLFEDAKSTAEWQSRFGFFPAYPQMSILLSQKMANPMFSGEFHAEDSHTCAKDTFSTQLFLNEHPEDGMPFGLPPISREDFDTLTGWLARGAPGPDPFSRGQLESPSNGYAGVQTLLKWEDFLNQPDMKTRLMSRYIFEHLFLAHIRFDEIPGDFYRLVRSRSASPQPVDEIATVRPYDDPKAPIYYRFRRITQTIVRKTHINYQLNDAKMDHLRELFLKPDWGVAQLHFPSYAPAVASNPFIAFKDIPARARYQFMLDDAFYHVMAFIRGPVCKGNVALNVIEPHFYIMFLSPDSDLTITHKEFLPQVGSLLKLPAQGESGPDALYLRYKADQMKYEQRRQELYKQFGSQGTVLEDLWNGDGHNDNAILTVYRHVDSADVIKGAWGGTPKTAWVMDYPIFERMYYDLVAGFDVYGNVVHQISTRMYMDNLRIEAEDEFLQFLPRAQRYELRKYWYRGEVSKVEMDLLNPLYEKNIETRIAYKDPSKAKEAFLDMALNQRMSAQVRGPMDPINSHEANPKNGDASPSAQTEEEIDREFAKVTKTPGNFTQLFPDVSLIRVVTDQGQEFTYTMIHNKEQLNVSFMFIDTLFRDPEADDLQILKGVQGSYPNFFFLLPSRKIGDFLNRLRELDPKNGTFARFIGDYGIRRMDPQLWNQSDWFNAKYRSAEPTEAGVLDLSRYENF